MEFCAFSKQRLNGTLVAAFYRALQTVRKIVVAHTACPHYFSLAI